LNRRTLNLLALGVAVGGAAAALITGLWRSGLLGLSLGLAVLLYGIGAALYGQDRAAGWVLAAVGALVTAGHVIQLLLPR
jgi:hypothetical protein